jgi:SNF2 family DNA or RNA helicase
VKLRDYQETAADFLYEHDRAMILAPVGAGKTAITITAMDDMWRSGEVGNGRWLVVAPKRVCTDVWPTEIAKWSKHLSCAVAVGTPAQRKAAFADPAVSGANVVVINYDNLQWLSDVITAKGTRKSTLKDAGFSGIVFDELTKLKNPSGARFKALHKILHPDTIVWGLTGSFTSNGLEDVFGQCKIVDQSLLGRAKGAFMQQYFVLINKDFGEWEPRKGSLELVMQRIKPATFVLEPGEYKDKLPPLHTVEVACKMDMTGYNKMKKDFVLDDVVAVNAAVVTQKLQQMSSGFLYSDNGPIWLSSHKFDRLEELLDENQHANTLLVYQYQEELAELKRRFKHLTTLDDEGAIKRWNRGEVRLLAVHPKSAGHGLNLQHGGCHVVFLSLPWSLELYEQTLGRLHRSGQKNPVWCYVFLTDGTVDHKIWTALHDKLSLSQIALEALK